MKDTCLRALIFFCDPCFRAAVLTWIGVSRELYPGYSSDFHDGTHQLVLGGSYATLPRLSRRTFVNWSVRSFSCLFIVSFADNWFAHGSGASGIKPSTLLSLLVHVLCMIDCTHTLMKDSHRCIRYLFDFMAEI